MNIGEIARLEHASRSVMGWTQDYYEPRPVSALLTAATPAIGILAVCAVMLIAIF